MKSRIIEFLKVENKSSAQFAEEIGVQPSSISHIISGRNNPSLDFVVKMLKKYPALSSDWLLFGHGTMYREKSMNDLFSAIPATEHLDHEENSPVEEENVKHEASERIYTGQNSETRKIILLFSDGTFAEYFPKET